MAPVTPERDPLNLGISVTRCRADAPPQPQLFGFSPPSTVDPKLELGPSSPSFFNRQSLFPFLRSSSGPDRTLNTFLLFFYSRKKQITDEPRDSVLCFFIFLYFSLSIQPYLLGVAARHFCLSHLHSCQQNNNIMESLLSLAFDNLSSYDGPKVRKGLRQVEGLLAQICLSNANAKAKANASSRNDRSNRRGDSDNDGSDTSSTPPQKDLSQLSRDPAFREFFKLQEGFEWNVAMRLISTLDRLMAKGGDGGNDLLILSSLDLIQGLLLLHPPSKSLFAREQNMNVCSALAFSATAFSF
jgi:hypothetical protein